MPSRYIKRWDRMGHVLKSVWFCFLWWLFMAQLWTIFRKVTDSRGQFVCVKYSLEKCTFRNIPAYGKSRPMRFVWKTLKCGIVVSLSEISTSEWNFLFFYISRWTILSVARLLWNTTVAHELTQTILYMVRDKHQQSDRNICNVIHTNL